MEVIINRGDIIEFYTSCSANRELLKGKVDYTDAMGYITIVDGVQYEVNHLVDIKVVEVCKPEIKVAKPKNHFKFGVYVTNTLNPDKNTNTQIVAKVTTQVDAFIIASALNKSVISSPLTYTVKELSVSKKSEQGQIDTPKRIKLKSINDLMAKQAKIK